MAFVLLLHWALSRLAIALALLRARRLLFGTLGLLLALLLGTLWLRAFGLLGTLGLTDDLIPRLALPLLTTLLRFLRAVLLLDNFNLGGELTDLLFDVHLAFMPPADMRPDQLDSRVLRRAAFLLVAFVA